MKSAIGSSFAWGFLTGYTVMITDVMLQESGVNWLMRLVVIAVIALCASHGTQRWYRYKFEEQMRHERIRHMTRRAMDASTPEETARRLREALRRPRGREQ